ncbi:viperin family antiviral radical SAM protein [Paracoccus actinidiae]|uniref:viperin family antiviral radical SAM protein n=1 Tax=Paracoccus actinidiae TaxID=3064531 RepID=UPI0027D23BBB|nr:viperin family antiviral radical SAM protein [Paracoccus sp. M09]
MVVEVHELVINWHIREECNFDCYFCYAKYDQNSSFRRSYDLVLRDLARLAGKRIDLHPVPIRAERIRINFAGGEPFLDKQLEPAIELAFELGLAPSFITNGSMITEAFVHRYGPMIAVAGFSLDSFSSDANRAIGRVSRQGQEVKAADLKRVFEIFRVKSPKTLLKINTVVCPENVNEDMRMGLSELRPKRWKMLRVIPIHGGRAVSDEEFKAFVARHRDVPGAVVEDNDDMHRSYIMIDPQARFYQREGSGYLRSPPITEVGAMEALRGVEFSVGVYAKRY